MGNMLPVMFNQQNTKIENAIVVAPQCPWNNQWVDTPWANGNYSIDNVPESNELKAVVELLDTIKSKYSTDENKYYAMGISMGGFGTWDLIMRHTEMFAGAVIMCGGADVSYAEKLKDMPIYTAHGTSDTTTVPYNNSTKPMVDALIKAGNENVIFKPVIGAGHVMWEPFAQDPEVIGWLFEQKQQ
jgi:predicted peptidase